MHSFAPSLLVYAFFFRYIRVRVLGLSFESRGADCRDREGGQFLAVEVQAGPDESPFRSGPTSI